jgi:hypothetical protein
MASPKLSPKVPVIVAAVVRPVARRLARMEDLLIEMRSEQDVQLKRAKMLQEQLDGLAELVRLNQIHIDRLAKINKAMNTPNAAAKTAAAAKRRPARKV